MKQVIIFKPDERIEVWQLFHHSSRLAIIDQLVRSAAESAERSSMSFHLMCRTAQFVESLGERVYFFVFGQNWLGKSESLILNKIFRKSK